MRRACALALSCLLLAGCATLGRNSSPDITSTSGSKAKTNATLPSNSLVIGRIISFDPRSLSVVIEVGAYAVLPPDFATRILVARTADLTPTARLQSSVYLRGRILGTRLLAGTPHVGDEVVCVPVP